MRRVALLLTALTLSGCALPLVNEPEAKEVSGPTDGYTPTAAYLKVNVKAEDGRTVLLDFDRREWAASEIAERIDQKEVRFLSAQAMPQLLNEYVVVNVGAPGELQALRYDEMGATPEQRAQYDAEYEQLLERFNAALPDVAAEPDAPELPVPTLP